MLPLLRSEAGSRQKAGVQLAAKVVAKAGTVDRAVLLLDKAFKPLVKVLASSDPALVLAALDVLQQLADSPAGQVKISVSGGLWHLVQLAESPDPGVASQAQKLLLHVTGT
jgi:hypothetical protein